MATSESKPESGPMTVPQTQHAQAMPLSEQTAPMSRVMPWVLSIMLHLGVGAVATFLGIVVSTPASAKPEPVIVDSFSGPVDFPMVPPSADPSGGGGGDRRHVTSDPPLYRKHDVWLDSDRNAIHKGLIDVIGPDLPGHMPLCGDVGGDNLFKNVRGGGGIGPGRGPGVGPGSGPGYGTGPGGGYQDIIFVIDRSGSMYDTFDELRENMKRFIAHMSDVQHLDVLMFSSGAPLEPGIKQLVPADNYNKREMAKFIDETACCGQTDPLPAIKRAFELYRGDVSRTKAILLLTDGAFPNNQAVEDLINQLNSKHRVAVYTYLFGPTPDDPTVATMKRIAQKNHGKYKYVCPN